MKKILSSNLAFTAGRLLVAAIFIGSSWYKIVSPASFAHEIYNFKLLPVWAINPVAIVLPWIQLFAGLFLLLNRVTKGSVLWLLGMMVVFQLAVASAMLRGLDISCGCFSAGGSPAGWLTLGRDFLIFLAVLFTAACVWVRERRGDN